MGGTWIFCTLSRDSTLAIEAVQATPLHISQHIDAAIIISTERAAHQHQHVRPLKPTESSPCLLSVTVHRLRIAARPLPKTPHQIRPVRPINIVHPRWTEFFTIINTTTSSLACTWLPYANPNKHPACSLSSPSSPFPPLTSPHSNLPHTHSPLNSCSRLPLPLPYALSSLTVRLCVLPHLKLPSLVCSLSLA